jgi:excisionase family DNA binding protein
MLIKSEVKRWNMIIELVQNKRFLRPDEVAELLLITKRTVYRMVQDGRLGGVDLTKRPWRIPREAVIKLFEPEMTL